MLLKTRRSYRVKQVNILLTAVNTAFDYYLFYNITPYSITFYNQGS